MSDLQNTIDQYKAHDLPVQRSEGILYPQHVHDELKRRYDAAVKELRDEQTNSIC